MSDTITVELGERSYPIYIGAGLVGDPDALRSAVPSEQILVLTNEVVAPLYLQRVCDHFSDRDCHNLVLPDGEAHKTLASFERIMTFMLERRLERSACILALGGGVIGDLGGFSAACYQRGVAYVQIPTTLLAQVDSSVGGKTAVNHPLGKNMIGAFHQPSAVVADTETLTTLPDRELRAGIAEIIKYGLIGDYPFFEWLEGNIDDLTARHPGALVYAIRRSCENKAAIVASDERESGVRAILNLGHTFGHAIETAMGYGNWLHGEAVAAGMCMAVDMSATAGALSRADSSRVESLIARAGLPTVPPGEIPVSRFLELMGRDKKNVGGRIRLVQLRSLGEAHVTRDYDDELLRSTLARYSTSDG